MAKVTQLTHEERGSGRSIVPLPAEPSLHHQILPPDFAFQLPSVFPQGVTRGMEDRK